VGYESDPNYGPIKEEENQVADWSSPGAGSLSQVNGSSPAVSLASGAIIAPV
jgi:hypothetical protein